MVLELHETRRPVMKQDEGENDHARHALEELNKSISLEPSTDAYYQRGQIFESQGEHQKAIQDYDQAIAQARAYAPWFRMLRHQHYCGGQGHHHAGR